LRASSVAEGNMPRVGKKRKKRRTEKEVDVSEKEKQKTPRCFVLKRGAVGQRIKDLVQDFRMVMLPNCAKSLKESKMNRVEDFMAVAGHYGVSHLIIFTTTKLGTYMKLAKLPQGPTLTFKVLRYSLARDIRATQKRPRSGARDYTASPLQVLNGFGNAASDGGDATKSNAADRQLMAEMLRGLFPSIDVPSFNQAECRRVALFHREAEKDTVEFRHYNVSRRHSGYQKGISALLNKSRLPKLSRKQDLADFILSGGASGSDDEDMEADSSGGGKIAVRLTEVGPRLQLQLVKCEDGVMGGAVLFHRYMTRTPTEQEVLEQRARQRRKLKERNQRLDQMAREHNKSLKQKRKDKEKAQAKKDRAEENDDGADKGNGFVGAAADDSDKDDAGGGAGPHKKRRFHPFGYGGKASSEKTVEMDSRPSKSKSRRGGQRQKDAPEDGKGNGKKGKGGGKKGGKGDGKGGRNGSTEKVLNRFRSSQKRKAA
jgi:ribosome biogenesis protein SSF1/2